MYTFDIQSETGDLSTTEPLRIGVHATDGFDAFFNGLIDEVTIYNRILSSDEVGTIFEAGTAGKCKGTPIITNCSLQTDIPKAECETLIALYNSTDGSNWTNHDGWLLNNSPCSWYKVSCSNARVESIVFENNQLSGHIPDLSALTNINTLWLSHGQLNGPIPDLSSLSNLRWLYLHNNQLSGSVPDLSMITSLQGVDLRDNQLSGSIPDLSGMVIYKAMCWPTIN